MDLEAGPMNNYALIIFWSKLDGAFVVEVPELPGCVADGATRAQAVENAEKVIQQWLDTAKSLGREVPVPKGRLAYA